MLVLCLCYGSLSQTLLSSTIPAKSVTRTHAFLQNPLRIHVVRIPGSSHLEIIQLTAIIIYLLLNSFFSAFPQAARRTASLQTI